MAQQLYWPTTRPLWDYQGDSRVRRRSTSGLASKSLHNGGPRSAHSDGDRVTWQGKLSRSDWRRFGIVDPLSDNDAHVQNGKVISWNSSWSVDRDQEGFALPVTLASMPLQSGSSLWLQTAVGLLALLGPLGVGIVDELAENKLPRQEGRMLASLLEFANTRPTHSPTRLNGLTQARPAR
jgi:hypothetical protein